MQHEHTLVRLPYGLQTEIGRIDEFLKKTMDEMRKISKMDEGRIIFNDLKEHYEYWLSEKHRLLQDHLRHINTFNEYYDRIKNMKDENGNIKPEYFDQYLDMLY